jgi:CubicO group peptidase (beta-lactamase class C family)
LEWIRASWTPRTASPFSGDDYGYGWFIAEAHGHKVYYARGFGGQLLYVVPSLSLTVVITSSPNAPARSGGYFSEIEALLGDSIIPAVLKAR